MDLKPAGMKRPPDPPAGADALAVMAHYLTCYDEEYARIRNLSKASVSRVITTVAAVNAAIAVLGVASATWKYPWFGLASTALAGLVGLLAARNNLFRDQELWHLRSATLSNLQQLRRDMHLRVAAGEDAGRLARDLQTRLDAILGADLEGWAAMVRVTTTQSPGTTQTGP